KYRRTDPAGRTPRTVATPDQARSSRSYPRRRKAVDRIPQMKRRRGRWLVGAVLLSLAGAAVFMIVQQLPHPPIVIGGYKQAVSAVAFTPDSKRIVTASWDKLLRIYDARTGALQMVLTGASVPLYCVAVSP